eukprot:GHVU01142787.1.p2 GENE.GHVU01142787.1~~GHVU01142787.1.p2  ORF type:complete len:108 (-),score=2.15 GHVU01142787.1:47-370(-)
MDNSSRLSLQLSDIDETHLLAFEPFRSTFRSPGNLPTGFATKRLLTCVFLHAEYSRIVSSSTTGALRANAPPNHLVPTGTAACQLHLVQPLEITHHFSRKLPISRNI